MTTGPVGAPTNQNNTRIMTDPSIKGNMTAEYKETLFDLGIQTLALLEPITTDDATDLATAVALANAVKAKVNLLLETLFRSGMMGTPTMPPGPPIV